MDKLNCKKELNIFFFDATSFISKAAELAKPNMNDNDAILATLLASIGFEKILKGILWDINPIFVYEDSKFERLCKILYRKNIIEEEKLKDLNGINTITFKNAILRSKMFSKTVSSHVALLHKLATIRDIIAHNTCGFFEIDRNFIRSFLLKKLKPLIKVFNEELKFKKHTFFEAIPWVLSRNYGEKEEQEIPLEDEIAEKIKKHKLIWNKRKEDLSFISEKSALMKKLENITENIIIVCPACGNYSLLHYEPDYEYSDGQSWLAGLFVTQLDCLFCDFNIINYDEIDYLKLNNFLESYWRKK